MTCMLMYLCVYGVHVNVSMCLWRRSKCICVYGVEVNVSMCLWRLMNLEREPISTEQSPGTRLLFEHRLSRAHTFKLKLIQFNPNLVIVQAHTDAS